MIGDIFNGLEFPMVFPKVAGLTSGDVLDADALDWQTRVAQNGSSVSAYTLRQVSEFCKACKRLALWDSLLRVNLFAGDTLNACLVPLKIWTGNGTETNSGSFAEADYVECGSTAGLKGDGTGKYLNTGFNASTMDTSDAHAGAYWKGTEAGGTTRCVLGSWNAGGHTFGFAWQVSGSIEVGAIGSTGSSNSAGQFGVSQQAGNIVTVNGSRVQTYYLDGVASGATPTAADAIQNQPLFVGCMNNAGSPLYYSTRYIRGYHIGRGLSGPEAYNLAQIMIDFQSSLSRKV